MNNGEVREFWWLSVVAGIATMLFGIAALFWPGLTLVTLVYLFSAYIVAWGLIEVIKSLTRIDSLVGRWWLSLVFGVVALGVGVYLVRHPDVSFGTLVLLIGFTLVIRGVFDIVAGFFENSLATSRVLSVIMGVAAVVAGVFVLRQPEAGGVAFVWILGLFALISGPLMIAMAVDAKNALEATVVRNGRAKRA